MLVHWYEYKTNLWIIEIQDSGVYVDFEWHEMYTAIWDHFYKKHIYTMKQKRYILLRIFIHNQEYSEIP